MEGLWNSSQSHGTGKGQSLGVAPGWLGPGLVLGHHWLREDEMQLLSRWRKPGFPDVPRAVLPHHLLSSLTGLALIKSKRYEGLGIWLWRTGRGRVYLAKRTVWAKVQGWERSILVSKKTSQRIITPFDTGHGNSGHPTRKIPSLVSPFRPASFFSWDWCRDRPGDSPRQKQLHTLQGPVQRENVGTCVQNLLQMSRGQQ